jgi:predicted helicase
LLSQILNDWTFAARDKFDALCVCSDQTVNRREEDEAISLVSDLPFPVSSRDGDCSLFETRQRSGHFLNLSIVAIDRAGAEQ